ncbi:hypothetical protein SAMN05216404_106212 [Nitrosospira multiformis]|uniref:Uncharacterized protein n=1 Tax=Nitrosospira multiformis TaxID=1231 RepID=A0A1H8IXT8_9PROT|nr:hypothetical protein [Nitrosospira multiformis]SEN72995.1 hypothetical protein SAMN05216404_106212 [Nitrosospira multiformis]
MKIPDGWKLVPIEPTEEMIKEMCDGYGEGFLFVGKGASLGDGMKLAYAQGLAAAPTFPAEDQK